VGLRPQYLGPFGLINFRTDRGACRQAIRQPTVISRQHSADEDFVERAKAMVARDAEIVDGKR
jgi:hypothetical protein